MKIYLEDLQEAEANVTRSNNEFLRERGWVEVHNRHRKCLLWNKTFMRSEMRQWSIHKMEDATTTVAEMLTTEEAIDLEKVYGSRNLHKPDLSLVASN